MTTTAPISLNYASKEWMIERLDRMGLVGTAAEQSKSIVEPQCEEGSAAVQVANSSHERKYKMDQRSHLRAAQSLTAFQSSMYSGNTPAGSPQVQLESPNDIWVQPRAHPFYSADTVHIADQDTIKANEPWRIKPETIGKSIKNVNTK